MCCHQTTTGIKFILMADPAHTDLQRVINSIYKLYNDFVLKNPFYELDQPIKSEKFDINLDKLIASEKK